MSENVLSRYGYTGPVNALANARFGPSGWDRDSVLPFARRVDDGDVVRGGGIMGSDWHLAVPQFAADALQAAVNVGSSNPLGPYYRGAGNREAMTETAGAVVGPMAGAGMARNALAGRGGSELGIFGGRLAKTADQAALAKAEQMATANVPREAIWNETGWFQGPDGKWRFEIDDSGARLRRRGDAFERQYNAIKDDRYPEVRDLMRHDQMAAAYPSIMSADVRLLPRSTEFDGQYLNGTFSINRELPRGEVGPTMLHEMQHGIQDREGFSKPGKYQRLTDDEYRRAASEVESRTVEKRMDMTPEQRRARAPWLDYDVPEIDQIVRY
jgi:hypothetical protein